jgi:hypothetical protein
LMIWVCLNTGEWIIWTQASGVHTWRIAKALPRRLRRPPTRWTRLRDGHQGGRRAAAYGTCVGWCQKTWSLAKFGHFSTKKCDFMGCKKKYWDLASEVWFMTRFMLTMVSGYWWYNYGWVTTNFYLGGTTS